MCCLNSQNIKYSKRLFVFALTSVSFSTLSATESSTNSQETEPSETIVVTAAGYDQLVANASASISVLTREEIENAYYTDVTDAISSIPGVIVAGGGDSTKISIRGMESSYTVLLIDGQPVDTEFLHPNSGGNFTETSWLPPLQAIERIEVIRGPMSTLYGSNAMGGVINIITRKAQQDWTGNIQLGTVIQGESQFGDEQNVNFFLTGPVSEKLSLNLSGKRNHRDEDEFEEGRQERTTTSLSSKATYQINEQHQLMVDAETSKQEAFSSAAYTGGGTDGTTEYKKANGSIEHKGEWQTLGTSDTFLKYDVGDRIDRDIKIQEWDFKSTFVTPLSATTLSYGLQGNHERLDDETTNGLGDLTTLSNTALAIFAEDEWQINKRVALTLGARYDHDQKYGSHVSPRIYAVWNINDPWTLKGGVSTGFRAPTMKESSANWARSSNGGDKYGNPDLEPETSVSEELSVEYRARGGIVASLGLFNNSFSDKIDTEDCTSVTCSVVTKTNGYGATVVNQRYVNIGNAVTRGVEFAIDMPITDTVDFNSSYTYTYSKITSGDSSGLPLNQLPKNMWINKANWNATDDLQVWSKVTYRGETSEAAGSSYSSSSSDVVPSYTMTDTGVSYQLMQNLKINAAIYNLFNREVEDASYGYTEDGRRYWLSMNMDF